MPIPVEITNIGTKKIIVLKGRYPLEIIDTMYSADMNSQKIKPVKNEASIDEKIRWLFIVDSGHNGIINRRPDPVVRCVKGG